MDGIYDVWQTKTIIGTFDMLVSGRIHAAVAGLSQSVPTVIVDYGHKPKAHKLMGFAAVVGITEYVATPANNNDLNEKIEACWNHCQEIRSFLDHQIPEVKKLSRENFTRLQSIL